MDVALVNEVHNLNLATATGADMSDHLYYLAEQLPATFVRAGTLRPVHQDPRVRAGLIATLGARAAPCTTTNPGH